jgi:hypothetical protein
MGVEDEGGDDESLPRRTSSRAAALMASKLIAGASNSSDVDATPAPEELLVPAPRAPEWMTAEEQSINWYMPQIGDRVRMFHAGLLTYFAAFCPGMEAPQADQIENVVWTVSGTSFACHQEGVVHCRVTLSSAEHPPVTVPFHSNLFMTDYMVHESCVARSLVAGSLVQAFFADDKRWYSGTKETEKRICCIPGSCTNSTRRTIRSAESLFR